jgi:hypothetical protein
MGAVNYRLGDRVELRRTNRGNRDAGVELVVYKVGRKWGFAKPEGGRYPDVKFDLETGYEDGCGYASTRRVLTPEQDAQERRRKDAVAEMKASRITLDFGSNNISTEALEQIVAILRADREARAAS